MGAEAGAAFILAGGRGERFWPLSSRRRPKQLLALVGDRPLLAETVRRLTPWIPPERTWVITNAEYVEAARQWLPELPPAQIVGEPMGRDTAAAVALALGLMLAHDPEGVFAVLPSDHVIGEGPAFLDTLRTAFRLASHRKALIVVGIPPTAPVPSFGYIEAGPAAEDTPAGPALPVRRFVEKPDVETARRYLAAGNFYWNAGLFVWQTPVLLAALRRHAPRHAELAECAAKAAGRPEFENVLRTAYANIEKTSIDYALMEKAENVLMIPANFRWDDMGTWTTLRNHFPADADGNVIVGDGVALDAGENIVYSPGRLTALLGVRELIVVQAEGVTLVCRRDQADAVKKLVRHLHSLGRYEDLL
jgi:mannose-1-phosphate guanylyltransferase